MFQLVCVVFCERIQLCLGIENYVRFLDNWGTSFIKTENGVLREKISFADPSFFTEFSFKLKYGNAALALQDLHSIVLTETTAEQIFGKTNAIGKTIEIKTGDKFEPFIVTAIAVNLPSNSSLQFSMFCNFNYFATTEPGSHGVDNWNQISYQTFVHLKAGSTLPGDKRLLSDFRKKYYPDEEKEARKNGWKGNGSSSQYGLQPLNDIHTNTILDGGVVPAVDPKTIWILLSIAGGILLIACINFTTLAIGRSASRSKEVGVRKVIGGTRKSFDSTISHGGIITCHSFSFDRIITCKYFATLFQQVLRPRIKFFSYAIPPINMAHNWDDIGSGFACGKLSRSGALEV